MYQEALQEKENSTLQQEDRPLPHRQHTDRDALRARSPPPAPQLGMLEAVRGSGTEPRGGAALFRATELLLHLEAAT